MSQAEQEIADLDFSLAADGQTIVLSRASSSVDCLAFVRGLDKTQLAGSISQQEFKVIISPTQIDADVWPSAPDSPAPSVDPRIPIKGDKVTVAGRLRTVQDVLPMFVGDVLVRIEMKVLG